MAGAIREVRQSSIAAGQFDIKFVVCDQAAHGIARAQGQKKRESGNDRHQPTCGHTRRSADHVGFGNAKIVEPVAGIAGQTGRSACCWRHRHRERPGWDSGRPAGIMSRQTRPAWLVLSTCSSLHLQQFASCQRIVFRADLLAVPLRFAFHEGHAFTLDGFSHNHG